MSGYTRSEQMLSALLLIVLQKSKVAGLEIFRENTTRELIADSYTLSPVTEVTCAFNVTDPWSTAITYALRCP
jgi:hypothetical protein